MACFRDYFSRQMQQRENGYDSDSARSLRDVLHCFLRVESTKNGAGHFKELYEKFEQADGESQKRTVREFAEKNNNGSPIFPWTVGYRNDERWRQVRRWIYAEIKLDHLYTCGISASMSKDLEDVRGNLKMFASLHATKYPEFRVKEVPPEAVRIIFGVARMEDDRDGTIELIDGAHRVVCLLFNSISTANGFIAEL
jgi:hypothetical protein